VIHPSQILLHVKDKLSLASKGFGLAFTLNGLWCNRWSNLWF